MISTDTYWLVSLIVIFALYLLWDLLTIGQYKEDFNPSTSVLGYYPQRGPD
jgi:hypothetical protein